MLSRYCILAISFLLVLQISGASHATESVDGILAVADAGEDSYLAVRVEIPEGEAVESFRWINNDETAQPAVRIVPGLAGTIPDVSAAGAAIGSPTWASLDWVTGSLDDPVITTDGLCYILFRFPSYNVVEDEGSGGGCGIAYRTAASGFRSAIAHDGANWEYLHPSIAVQVEVDFTDDAGAVVLQSGNQKRMDGPESSRASGNVELAVAFELDDAYPNPFNPATNLVFRTALGGRLALNIYDGRGRLVRRLRSGQYPPGEYRVRWNGLSDTGATVASGVYYARLVGAGSTQVRRLVLLK